MWILSESKTEIYNAKTCQAIYVLDGLDIVLDYGDKCVSEDQLAILGRYNSVHEARTVFQSLTDWLEHPQKVKIFNMPQAGDVRC